VKHSVIVVFVCGHVFGNLVHARLNRKIFTLAALINKCTTTCLLRARILFGLLAVA
jgi:hypothetical protein